MFGSPALAFLPGLDFAVVAAAAAAAAAVATDFASSRFDYSSWLVVPVVEASTVAFAAAAAAAAVATDFASNRFDYSSWLVVPVVEASTVAFAAAAVVAAVAAETVPAVSEDLAVLAESQGPSFHSGRLC